MPVKSKSLIYNQTMHIPAIDPAESNGNKCRCKVRLRPKNRLEIRQILPFSGNRQILPLLN